MTRLKLSAEALAVVRARAVADGISLTKALDLVVLGSPELCEQVRRVVRQELNRTPSDGVRVPSKRMRAQ